MKDSYDGTISSKIMLTYQQIWTSLNEFEQVNLEKIVEGIFLNDVFNFGMFVFRFFLRIMSVIRSSYSR